jgi:hypothetical protein
MKQLLILALFLFTTCSEIKQSDCVGEWVLKQETTSVGTVLSVHSNQLSIRQNGTFQLEDIGKISGTWIFLHNDATNANYIILREQQGTFSTFAIDTLTTEQLILRNGFGRRLIYQK